ncbi:adenylyltransferase/cytidyltransferase family protein [Horticoccus sp. 23ND18S-11]|uniref:adenylyltransferase/cytidyltransferase family protein n=1 Tax=Horticoccus sp. 23ND18S-11 TaxID=3391832 RepID=UPI0039C959BD
MIRVFVSGCYDILHAGHVQFFREARALGDHLTVCFASNDVLWLHKQRRSSLPDEHKRALIAALATVDEVVIGQGHDEGIDFKEHFLRVRPDILAVTDDDKYGPLKRALCAEVGARYVVMPKTPPQFPPISTTQIVKFIRAPEVAPLRVDFGGGWLDVPRLARDGAYIVNCAISPTVSLREWPYERNAGLGGSGAWALLNGRDGVGSELDLGVGWQDPAVIAETGLCVWRSGQRPVLEVKTSGDFLRGRLALYWTGVSHDTPGIVAGARDYDAIARAGATARDAVWSNSLTGIAEAVRQSYAVQRAEGMAALPAEIPGMLAAKYCGGGFGGYAAYVFAEPAARDAACAQAGFRPIEPFVATR